MGAMKFSSYKKSLVGQAETWVSKFTFSVWLMVIVKLSSVFITQWGLHETFSNSPFFVICKATYTFTVWPYHLNNCALFGLAFGPYATFDDYTIFQCQITQAVPSAILEAPRVDLAVFQNLFAHTVIPAIYKLSSIFKAIYVLEICFYEFDVTRHKLAQRKFALEYVTRSHKDSMALSEATKVFSFVMLYGLRVKGTTPLHFRKCGLLHFTEYIFLLPVMKFLLIKIVFYNLKFLSKCF